MSDEVEQFHLQAKDGNFFRLVVTQPGVTFNVHDKEGRFLEQTTTAKTRAMFVIKDSVADDRSRFSVGVDQLEELWTFLSRVLNKVN